MAKHAKSQTTKQMPPPLTAEAAEAQMISLAMDCAKQQLIDGTASSQVITHFLKLGTASHKAEVEKLKLENKLLEAKTESIKASAKSEEMFREAIEAMKRYSGYSGKTEDD